MHEEPDNFPAPELTSGEAGPETGAADPHPGFELEQAGLELDALEEIQLPPVQAEEAEPPETGPEEGESAESGEEEAEPEEAELELEPAPPMEQYCIFRSGRERFCLHVLEVDEVVDWPRLTNLPLAPPFLMGIFNLRGTIVPVVDIAFTEVRRAHLSPKQVVVACLRDGSEGTEVRVGIAADEVIGTYSTCEELLQEEAPRDVPHCAGMLRHGDRLALALDLQRVLESFPVSSI